MVNTELFQLLLTQAVNTGITNMKQMCGLMFEYQRAKSADIAAVFIDTALTLLGLGIKTGIGGTNHPVDRSFDTPGIGRRKVIGQKTGHCGFTGDMTDIAAADTIGNGTGNALLLCQIALRNGRAVKILIDRKSVV